MKRSNHKNKLRGFRNALRDDGVLELSVYDEIGENYWTGDGITAKNFKAQIEAAGKFSRIQMRINSPGGDAFEGVAIYNLLRTLGKPVDVIVDGLAASAASIIAMAGSSILMGRGAMMMIHNAWGMCAGDGSEMEKMASTLKAIDGSIASIYAARTKTDQAEIQKLMDAETWLGADDCVLMRFATGINEGDEDDAGGMELARSFKALAKFKHTPKNLKASVDEECGCECGPCTEGNCEGCDNGECNDPNCEDCAMQASDQEAKTCHDQKILAMVLRAVKDGKRDGDIIGSDGTRVALRRIGSVSLKAVQPEAPSSTVKQLRGTFAPYNAESCDLGGYREVYERGCFNQYLATDDPRVLFNHNPDCVLGRKSAGTARFFDGPDGAQFEVDLPDTQAARDLAVSMERGDISESSAAFYILAHRWETRGGVRTRVIEQARLLECGPVSFAAYDKSSSAVADKAAADSTEFEYNALTRLRLLKIA